MGTIAARNVSASNGPVPPIMEAILVTFQMALVDRDRRHLEQPMALLAARNTSPYSLVRACNPCNYQFLRTVPDLAWGVVFRRLRGPAFLPERFTIIVRYHWACESLCRQRMEESDPGPSEALDAMDQSADRIVLSRFPEHCPQHD